MFKKMISFVLATSIVTSIFLVPAAAYEQQNTEPETEVVEMVSNGVKFTLVEDDEGRTVTYMEDGVVHKTRYEFATGALSVDGKCVSVVEAEVQEAPGSIVPYGGRYTWKLYDTSESDLMSDVATVAGWTSALFALFGVSIPDISNLAQAFSDSGLGIVYYIREKYYKDPVETSRPVTASLYKFYSDKNHKRYLGKADLRT